MGWYFVMPVYGFECMDGCICVCDNGRGVEWAGVWVECVNVWVKIVAYMYMYDK